MPRLYAQARQALKAGRIDGDPTRAVAEKDDIVHFGRRKTVIHHADEPAFLARR